MIEEPLTNPVKARVDAFHRRHGGVCFADYDEAGHASYYFYPDGAFRDINPNGVLADPRDPRTPEGEHTNAQNICMFYRLKLRKAVGDFDDLNTRLAHTLPNDQRQELAELARRQRVVEECKKEVEAAEAKLNATAISRRRAQVRQAEEERKLQMEEFQKQRRSIRI